MQTISRSGGAPARAEVARNSGYTTRHDAKPADFLSVLDAAKNSPAEDEQTQTNTSPLLAGARAANYKAATGNTGKQTGKNLPGALPDSGKTVTPKNLKDMVGGLTPEQAGATTHPVSGDDSDAAAAVTPLGENTAPSAITVLLGLTPPLTPPFPAQPNELADTGASSITPRAPLPTLPETKATAAQTALVQAAAKAFAIQPPVAEAVTANATPSATKAVADQVAAIRLAPVEVIVPKSVATEATLRAMPQAVAEAKPAIQPAPAAMTLSQDSASGENAPASTPMPQTATAAAKADTAGNALAAFAPLAATETAMPTITATPASLRTDAVVSTAAATPAAPAPHDFTTLVDRLVEAREAAQPNVIRTALAHAEFGTVSLQFRQDQTHMNVTVAGADPGLATAVQAAAAASLAAGAGNDDGAAPRQDNAQSQQQNQQQQAASTTSQGQQQSQARSEAAQRDSARDQAGLARKTDDDTSGKSPAAPATRRSGIFA